MKRKKFVILYVLHFLNLHKLSLLIIDINSSQNFDNLQYPFLQYALKIDTRKVATSWSRD